MPKILIIEDDQIVANIYRNKFAVEGFEAEVALDGDIGLDLLTSFKPDAILLDLMLPKMTGLEVMRSIRAQEAFKQVPIVVFSNTYLSNMVQDAWKAGATKCLSKANCSPKQVLDAVRSTLGNAAAPRPNGQAQPPQPANSEAEDQNRLRSSFIESLPATLTFLRGLLKALAKADTDPARDAQLQELYRRVHALTGNAGITRMGEIAQMADALEALIKEIYEKPRSLNASTMRTLASAIDTLGALFDRARQPEAAPLPTPSILVVDDEAISRRAIAHALDKAKLKAHCVESSEVAYNSLLNARYDLIFLDVDMPGMNGYELCAKLRELPRHRRTPVVFVTSLEGVEPRANSLMSGGNDFIAKPFLFMELAVKALIHLQRSQSDRAPAPAPAGN